MSENIFDTVVVGAGFSGLAAAARLVSTNKKVVVLEAQGRVGGKAYDPTFTTPTLSGYVETGASFIGPGQSEVAALSEKLGLKTFETYDEGNVLFYTREGQRKLYNPANPEFASPPLSSAALMQLLPAVAELDGMARELDITSPWNHPKARDWDSKTLQTWMDGFITDPDARELHTITWRSLLSAEPADVSLLQALTYIARATDGPHRGNWERLTRVKSGAQERRVEGGTSQIALGLADQLGSDVVRLNSPVRGIRKECDIYNVYVEASLDTPKVVFQARSIILAISPPLVSRLRFEPPLPARRDLMGQRMTMGSLGKAIAIYESPFWREDGLNGQAIGLHGGTVQMTFDDSPSDGSYGVLMGFLEADTARNLDDLTDEQVQELVLKDYIAYFGPRAANVQRWVIQRWNRDEYSRGGHFAFSPPNVMTVYGKSLADPVGNIYFAGTEMADRWSGFLEGAIIAGYAAADAVVKGMQSS